MKIKKLKLTNFKGHEKVTFEFAGPINLIYGPNGSGKSSVLEAVYLVSNPRMFAGREKDNDFYMRSLIHDDDYIPCADRVLEKEKNNLTVKGYFNSGSYISEISNEGIVLQRNSAYNLPDAPGGHAFYVDADNPSNMAKFQLLDICAEQFIVLAEAIYGYKCDLDGEVWDERTGEDGITVKHLFYNDLILLKNNKRVHYAQMSAGEKKIATLLRELCNPDNTGNKEIILIDNIDLHVYRKRHVIMVQKLVEVFQNKQFIITAHSSEVIEYVENLQDGSTAFDLENYPYPQWVKDIYSVEDFDKRLENAILMDIDDDGNVVKVFDPKARKHPIKVPRLSDAQLKRLAEIKNTSNILIERSPEENIAGMCSPIIRKGIPYARGDER